jgi:hypothetical protein
MDVAIKSEDVDDLIAESDKVVVRWRLVGTTRHPI